VEVVLLRPLPERSSEIDMSRPNLSFRPYLPPNAQLGNLRVKVGVFLNDRMEDVLPVSVEVRLFQTVVRAARPIDRGAVLDKDNVHVERVALTQRMDGSTADEMLGKKARRALAPGSLIQERDVDNGLAQDPILIRPRDSVRLVARKRGLTVIVSSAEALQAGRRGDTIQVRNTTSKKIITGRVVDQSEVEVAF
ncbi:MAG: flagellar basal body P-ring formation chaperone FlgA, partial [Planctomycetaceae bacterium]